jgi:hypothetical protein
MKYDTAFFVLRSMRSKVAIIAVAPINRMKMVSCNQGVVVFVPFQLTMQNTLWIIKGIIIMIHSFILVHWKLECDRLRSQRSE